MLFLSLFSEVFVSDVRLTVIYFSTDPLKKQVLFSLFFELFCGSSFCPVFSLRFGRSVHHSSNSLSRITFNILRSRREICTCVVWSSFAVSLWVLPP